MGLVSRSTAAALLLAAPVVVASASLAAAPAAAATRAPAQASTGKVNANEQFKFDPPSITVAVGGKVTWTNTGGGFHTVTGGDNGTPDASSPVGDGVLDATGKTYSVTFDKAGTYAYFCRPHAGLGMKGEIVVAAAGGASPVPSPANSGGGASSAPPASASASASVGAPQEGAGAPTPGALEGDDEEVPGIPGNKTLAKIEAERAAEEGAVSGFRFFTMVAVAFLLILGAAVLFSTRPRRAGR
ncbi:MAG TPA: plastocyanin/azurin family copper-binding protein [Mycobacteriales bacterium]|jgi:plastocyanin|nr:plastocyanin/azurin family copper-binding protein [Mycobacteriales bacterium]